MSSNIRRRAVRPQRKNATNNSTSLLVLSTSDSTCRPATREELSCFLERGAQFLAAGDMAGLTEYWHGFGMTEAEMKKLLPALFV
jgi:hypothetical protein